MDSLRFTLDALQLEDAPARRAGYMDLARALNRNA